MGAGKIDVPPEFGQLADLARTMIAQTNRPRKLLLQQLTEALRTGGVKARIPMIQQAVSASNQATANALRQSAEDLASRNIGGPFASRILAAQRQAGAQTAGMIPTQMAQQLIAQTVPFLQATQGLGAGALGQAGAATFNVDAFNAQQFKAAMEDIKDSIQGAAMAGAGCFHPNTMVETPDGARRIDELRLGDPVWTRAANGDRVRATVVEHVRRHVGPAWRFLQIHAPGGTILVSPTHLLADGEPVGARVAGPYVLSGDVGTEYTVDIRVSGSTGIYFVCGVAFRSTLDVDAWTTEATA